MRRHLVLFVLFVLIAGVLFGLLVHEAGAGERFPVRPEFGDVLFMGTQATCPGEPPASFALLCYSEDCGHYQWWDIEADTPFLSGIVDQDGVGQMWVDRNHDGTADKYYTTFAELLKEYPNLCDHRMDSVANQAT